MQRNLLWTGREYYSLENCLVNSTDSGFEITSTIVGMYQGEIYRVEYQIKTNRNWETVFFELRTQHRNLREHLRFESDGQGNWMTNGKQASEFTGCLDIDISLTPFTNTLPINRLKLRDGSAQEIQVIYVDVFGHRIKPIRQKYNRLSDTEYQYENVPNDFEARIQVDEQGLVVDYPFLFVRTASQETNYH
jgi:uncharacterized protein